MCIRDRFTLGNGEMSLIDTLCCTDNTRDSSDGSFSTVVGADDNPDGGSVGADDSSVSTAVGADNGSVGGQMTLQSCSRNVKLLSSSSY